MFLFVGKGVMERGISNPWEWKTEQRNKMTSTSVHQREELRLPLSVGFIREGGGDGVCC